ncbi:MAG: Nif3-like dinuclear metal center hexameric protein [Oscillospiraceae bacterium]|jgi:dinuclear metal center YbgI/SA1388 family protein|nr:Nif3-like dinuclear metal center hexameric protein [Ruminococcus sp.]
MITIDNRLKVCADMVSGNGIVCDVGTDHAYLPAYLIENNICDYAIASDINEGPLKFAQQTIIKYHIEDKIRLLKSDGLKNIPSENVSDVVIAGMGGETIAEIISGTQWLKSGVNLVLQPMTRAGYLRKWLYKNGFEIAEEKAVIQDRFIYTAIRAFYSGYKFNIGKVTEIAGRINIETDAGMKYCQNQLSKINNIAMGLSKAGKTADSQEYQRIAERLTAMMEGKMNLVSEIYTYIDSFAPFSTQEKWDNSGLLTGSMNKKVSKVLVTLDITNEVADEAAEIGAELIIAHHPVIFKPLYSLSENEPSCKLLKSGISAICVHTPYDVAEGGMSDILMELTGFEKTEGILEITGQNYKTYGFGTIGIASQEYQVDELAKKLKNVLGCTVVRYTDGGKPIKKAAFCTGSGGNLIIAALNQGADAYITSEVKHDQWLLAKQRGISVFDCGHFHTENIGMIRLCKMLAADFSNIEFVMSEVNKDPVKYVL